MLTFLAEWGDRSQIATISLAAHQNPLAVCLGAVLGLVEMRSIIQWLATNNSGGELWGNDGSDGG